MNFEKKLISGCIQDPDVVTSARRAKIRPKHFDKGVYRYLYSSILDISKSDVVTPEVLKAYIKVDETKHDKKSLIKKVDDLASQGVNGANFSLKKLEEKRANKDMLSVLNEATEALLDSEDPNNIINTTQRKLKKIKSQEEDYELFDYYEDWDNRQVDRAKVVEDDGEAVKMCLNLSPFKKYFPRGIQRCEMTAVAGPTYSGKSVFLSNMVRVAAHPENGFNVLYVFSENRRIQAASRLDSIFLNMEYDLLYLDGFDNPEGDKFFEGAVEEGWGRIFGAKVKLNNFTAATMDTIIDEIEDVYDCKVDVLAVDSPEHQLPEVGMNDKWWQKKAEVYYDNKSLVEDRNMFFFSTLQMKASSVKKDSVSNEDTAGSYEISRALDNLFAFNVDSEDRLLNRGKIQVTKARDNSTDNKKIYFYFDDTHRLLPWDEVFNGNIEADVDAGDEVVYKINQYSKKRKYDKGGSSGSFNVKKG